MQTSYFGNVRNIPEGCEPVGIARGNPRGYRGRSYKGLAPARAMLKLPRAEYDAQFDAILAQLDPQQTYADLGENAVLLCWEAPGVWCHRRRVTEWLEAALGVEIPELGELRNETLPYDEMPAAKT